MPDILFHGGPIHTLDPDQPLADALLVRGDTIIAVGSADDVRKQARAGYEDVALRSRALVPGLCDAHIHLLWTGQNLDRVDLADVPSLDEALDRIKQHAARLPLDAWVRGHGWNHDLWGGRWPTAKELDRVTGGRPAMMSRKDAHSAWSNTRALELAGVHDDTPDPDGGIIGRDEQGQATGMLWENAMSLVYDVIPEPTLHENMQALRAAFAACNRYGIISVHTPDPAASLPALQALRATSELNLRVLHYLPLHQLEQAIALGIRSGFGDEWLRIGGVKIFSDGALGSQTASMLAPFIGSDNRGVAMHTDDALHTMVRQAYSNGLAVMIHAIGDRANRVVLDSIAAALDALAEEEVAPALPNRIEHAQHLDPSDIGRFGELSVVASVQPIHATADIDAAERLLGPERAAWSYAFRSLMERGALLAFGSDSPVETFDPWTGIHAAVTRQRQNNHPDGGWHSEQAVDLRTALEAYTINPARIAGDAHIRGRLTPGMRADLVVLNTDPFAIDAHDLWQVKAEHTFVGGRSVWEEPNR